MTLTTLNNLLMALTTLNNLLMVLTTLNNQLASLCPYLTLIGNKAVHLAIPADYV